MKTSMLLLAAAAAAFAQPPAGSMPRTPDVSSLKTYLSLTDAQVNTLQQARQSEMTALRSVFEEIQTKETALRNLLNTNTTDAAAVGRLVLDIQTARKKVESTQATYRTQAVNTLTADQKTKLTALDTAMKLRDEIQQAVMLNLLQPEEGPGGPGFGGPGFGPGGPGGRGFGPPPGGMMMRNPRQ